MRAATIHEIKKELESIDSTQVKELCLRLGKFKKENKELLTYLLFEAQDERGYIENGKREMTELFNNIPNLNVYYLKKSLRKILRIVNKHIKYSGIPTTELELRIHFCEQIKDANMPLDKSIVLKNMYEQQMKKIHLALGKLDEDLQYDYQAQIERL